MVTMNIMIGDGMTGSGHVTERGSTVKIESITMMSQSAGSAAP